ncbi:unnamed protein product [Protopolystoma xenopodis]|uniref:Uncharacterized protein n=1 Tax=Protopolystoma xenopodis TaxID=117903 RepID=A0A448WKD7_9PLAT|nr:unnamed protein product [Protopolystoma xenopodis]
MDVKSVSEDGGLRRVLAKQNFDPEKCTVIYIANLSLKIAFINTISVVKTVGRNGELDVERTIHGLQRISVESSTKVKQAIYSNYKLFIDAGKAATALQSTIHQMQHDIGKQNKVLHSILELSLFPGIFRTLRKGLS